MIGTVLGILAGDVALQQVSTLPPWPWAAVILPAGIFLIRYKRLRWAGGIGLGFAYALIHAHLLLYPLLPASLEGIDLLVEGKVASLPEETPERLRFAFDIDRINLPEGDQPWRGRLVLTWYEATEIPQPGDVWRFQVRLKRPWGFMNPGGFDYEGWLFRQGIKAQGYVRKATVARNVDGAVIPVNLRLDTGMDIKSWIDRRRSVISRGIEERLEGGSQLGLVQALTVGEYQAISPAQWQVLRRTGTTHLMTISGLHIGLVAGLVFTCVLRLWVWIPGWGRRLSALKVAALTAVMAAAVYAAMAGFSVPTQRALIMSAVVLGGIALQRHIRPAHILAMALLAVLLYDPLAVLAAGFWLSFSAVALILYTMSGRIGARGWWWRWGRVQWVIALGLCPLLLWQFQQAPLISPLTNLVAVPWVSLISVPAGLLGVALSWLPGVGTGLLWLAEWSLELVWIPLAWSAGWEGGQWTRAPANALAVMCAVIGVLLLLAPRGVPVRWVGLLLLLPLLWPPENKLESQQVQLTLLDVGQGLAMVVRTARHVLVYDTGPRFNDSFDTGRLVLVPYLRQMGINHIDTLIVSHGDMDHRGGVETLLEEIPVQRVLTSMTDANLDVANEACVNGQQWQWDGVEFHMLHPGAADGTSSENNRSCVLRISAGASRALLPGDIQEAAERELLRRDAGRLAADILVAPHHGSRTSSTENFIDVVKPRLVLFAVGYRNRFGFPKAEVVERYRRRQVTMLNSAEHGAITLLLDPQRGVELIDTHRRSASRYWNSRAGHSNPAEF